MGKELSTILDETRMLFLRYGIRSMTMDDIARSLRVSKKTLYQHVANKEDLVRQVIERFCREEKAEIDEIEGKAHNAIRECFEIGQTVISILQEMHPSFSYDLEKYYPKAWNSFLEFKEEVLKDVVRNLEKGVEEGLYREDFDPETVAKFYVQRIDIVFNGELFPPDRFSFPQVYREMFVYHLLGVANEKGRDLLYKELREGAFNSKSNKE